MGGRINRERPRMSKYYGVVGNRDHIKIDGEKRPFWEFLDHQPDGYLTSLVYMRKDLPDMPMIFDCGAWSYRNDEYPKITPESAYEGYCQLARRGDMLIAPDHMLIPDVDLDSRREFNLKSAKQFLNVVKNGFTPMATSHGMDLDERIGNMRSLHKMGYHHIAIGGIAARASQKRLVLEMVTAMRKEFPNIWIHVLGLSSPDYTAAWHRLGINSFDGSSHFKQAFTGGAFFTVESGKLKKWQASRPGKGELPTAPICGCAACVRLHDQGIDTRTYGSNENNMGRAAHNMNMLMQAQKIAVGGSTVLVSCVGKKTDKAMPSKDLYQSDWFKKARIWAETNGDRWYILSALHGLVHPDTIIEPYEKTLNTMTSQDRAKWASDTYNQIVRNIPVSKLVFLAGSKYRKGVADLLPINGYGVEIPMKGLGIGQQLAWLNQQNQKQGELFT